MYTAEAKAETKFEPATVKFPRNPNGKPGRSAQLRHDLSKVIQKVECRPVAPLLRFSDVPPAKACDTWMLENKNGSYCPCGLLIWSAHFNNPYTTHCTSPKCHFPSGFLGQG